MNIFVTDPCPKKSAQALDDKRVIKMILETAQILSTVIRGRDVSYADLHSLYKPTHVGHPCVKWAAQSDSNYSWLLDHMKALLEEYTARFGKEHKSGSLLPALAGYAEKMPKSQRSSFVNCTDFKHVPDVHEAYKQALSSKWSKDKLVPRWTRSTQPEWRSHG